MKTDNFVCNGNYVYLGLVSAGTYFFIQNKSENAMSVSFQSDPDLALTSSSPGFLLKPGSTYATNSKSDFHLYVRNWNPNLPVTSNGIVSISSFVFEGSVLSGFLASGLTAFDIGVTEDQPFTVIHNSIPQDFIGLGNSVPVSVSGLNDSSEIYIHLKGNTSSFKFLSNSWASLSFDINIGITNLYQTFMNLSLLTSFLCPADLSIVTSANDAWRSCSGLTSFPSVNLVNCLNLNHAFNTCSNIVFFPDFNFPSLSFCTYIFKNCTSLVCFSSLIIPSLTNGTNAFENCPSLFAPASSGDGVRDGDNAIAGSYVNPGSCP